MRAREVGAGLLAAGGTCAAGLQACGWVQTAGGVMLATTLAVITLAFARSQTPRKEVAMMPADNDRSR